jgi:glycosyltransferase involved in cell wall biosynthesis
LLIQLWRVPAEKIAIVENGVETDLFVPAPPAANHALRQELHAEGKFLVCYIGTMGMAHGLETLLDAPGQLQRQNSNAHFLLVGEGAEKERCGPHYPRAPA